MLKGDLESHAQDLPKKIGHRGAGLPAALWRGCPTPQVLQILPQALPPGKGAQGSEAAQQPLRRAAGFPEGDLSPALPDERLLQQRDVERTDPVRTGARGLLPAAVGRGRRGDQLLAGVGEAPRVQIHPPQAVPGQGDAASSCPDHLGEPAPARRRHGPAAFQRLHVGLPEGFLGGKRMGDRREMGAQRGGEQKDRPGRPKARGDDPVSRGQKGGKQGPEVGGPGGGVGDPEQPDLRGGEVAEQKQGRQVGKGLVAGGEEAVPPRPLPKTRRRLGAVLESEPRRLPQDGSEPSPQGNRIESDVRSQGLPEGLLEDPRREPHGGIGEPQDGDRPLRAVRTRRQLGSPLCDDPCSPRGSRTDRIARERKPVLPPNVLRGAPLMRRGRDLDLSEPPHSTPRGARRRVPARARENERARTHYSTGGKKRPLRSGWNGTFSFPVSRRRRRAPDLRRFDKKGGQF